MAAVPLNSYFFKKRCLPICSSGEQPYLMARQSVDIRTSICSCHIVRVKLHPCGYARGSVEGWGVINWPAVKALFHFISSNNDKASKEPMSSKPQLSITLMWPQTFACFQCTDWDEHYIPCKHLFIEFHRVYYRLLCCSAIKASGPVGLKIAAILKSKPCNLSPLWIGSSICRENYG